MEDGKRVVEAVKRDPETAPISAKMKALLRIAGKVRADGRTVTTTDIASARAAGATDVEVHDVVLIAAAFSMYNRYVDGLGTWSPPDPRAYEEIGAMIVAHGYLAPPPGPPP